MNPPKQMKARLEDKIVHNEKYVQYMFELTEPHRMQFDPGQYVSIKVSEKGERRSYSICSKPDIDHGFELLVDLAPNGVGCQCLENMQFGEEVELLGPLGMFTLVDTEEPELFFVATGSGIAPLRSMILNLLQTKRDKRPMTLYWGLRYVEDIFWEDEFQELTESFPNFKHSIILSRPTEDWPLSKGYVTDMLAALEKPAGAGYYLCGNGKMVKDAIKILQEAQVAEQNIHHELFY